MELIKEYFWHGLLKRPYKLNKIIDVGLGNQTIVLVHGLASKSQIWLPLVKILDKRKYRVISYDLLGFGSSPKPARASYSTEDHVRALHNSIKKDLPANEKVILVGHSMGCIVAANFTHSYESLVQNLVLYQPPILIDKADKISFHRKFYTFIASKPPLFANYARLVNKLFKNKLSMFESSARDWLPIEKSILNTILDQKTVNELKNLSTPTYVVYGRMDFVVSRLDAKKLALINPNINLHYVYEMHDITKRSSAYLKKLLGTL